MLRPGGWVVMRNPNRLHPRDQFTGMPLLAMLPRGVIQRVTRSLGTHRSDVRLYTPGGSVRQLRKARFLAGALAGKAGTAARRQVRRLPPGRSHAVPRSRRGQRQSHRVKIEIGAGTKPTPGYVHVDAVVMDEVDVVDDGRTLRTFGEGVAEEIYSHWFLEHVARHEVKPMLENWKRVLAPARQDPPRDQQPRGSQSLPRGRADHLARVVLPDLRRREQAGI